MTTKKFLTPLTIVTAFVVSIAAQSALADNHSSDHYNAIKDGNKAYTVKDKTDNLTGADKPIRKLDHKQPKNSVESKSDNTDSSKIGKGSSKPESADLGSNTSSSGVGN